MLRKYDGIADFIVRNVRTGKTKKIRARRPRAPPGFDSLKRPHFQVVEQHLHVLQWYVRVPVVPNCDPVYLAYRRKTPFKNSYDVYVMM